jgi:DNA primase
MESVAKVSAFSARNKTNGFKKTTAAVTTDPWIEGLARAYAPVETNEVINSPLVESALRNPYNPYVATGKFNAETMAYFQVGYCDDNDYFRDRAIITIHNEDGNLIGFSGRDMTGTESNKYRIKKGFKKGNCLYNLHRARNYISRKNPMVLVEGFGQAWRLHEAGVRTAVALMGKELTDEQYKLIMKYTTSIVLALDFDEPGIHATKKIVDRLEDKIDVRVMVSTQHPDTDLGDMEIEDVTEIYENSIPTYLWYNEIYRGLTK